MVDPNTKPNKDTIIDDPNQLDLFATEMAPDTEIDENEDIIIEDDDDNNDYREAEDDDRFQFI